jgi:hypothetical protein
MNSILISLFNQALRSGGSIKAGPATCHLQLQACNRLAAAKELQRSSFHLFPYHFEGCPKH